MIDESTARALLPKTWHPFFGRFGRLTTTQRVGIEPIVEGRSVVLCAPTASGKTEAVLAPMIERITGEQQDSPAPRILVICPTRALCNDLHRRIVRPVEHCGWTTDIKTGDSSSYSADDPPDLLVTTPESFDSLLSRHPASLQHVDGLMLDELHLLDGDARGDHLRTLVTRLGAFCDQLQVCAASATVARGQRLARQFAGPDAEVAVAEGERDREIEARLVRAATLREAVDAIGEEAEATRGSKLLVFANRRREVEWLAANLEVDPVFAHHGSLSKSERLRTEDRFLNAPSGVCVATMTLELGIDIGDVDRVVLINPPPNVASFTQRIGRSNRRGTAIRATCLYSSAFDRARFEHMIESARRGRLFVESVEFRPTIIAQQAVSLLFQNPDGWISAEALNARLPRGVRDTWTVGDCSKVLEKMRDEEYLHADSRGHFVADEPARRDYEYGQMHAHIESSAEVEVVDEATGRTIGTARWNPEDQSAGETGADGLLLGGKHREVTRVRDRQVYVEDADREEDPEFLSRMGPRYSYGLARDLARFLGYGADEIQFVREGHYWRIHHFLGTLWGTMFAGVLRQRQFRLQRIGPFFIGECRHRRSGLPDGPGPADRIEEDLRSWLSDRWQRLATRLQPGPWRRFVPDDMMQRWVEQCVRPGQFADVVAGMRFVKTDTEDE